MIRISKHTTKFSNTGKIENLSTFIDEYRGVCEIYMDHIWNDGYQWIDKDGTSQEFSVSKNLLKLPKYIDFKAISVNTSLSASVLRCLIDQVNGIIKSSVEKQKKRLYILKKRKNENIPRKKLGTLIKKIKENVPQKPSCLNINPELSSKCCEFQLCSREFDGFLKLSSLTKDKMEINIPIKFTKHTRKLISKNAKIKTSFLLKKDFVDIRWGIPEVPKKTDGDIIGADQGMKDILTFSNNTKTPSIDNHGHSLESIISRMSRKRRGSKNFRKCQNHRKNFINWSINQLDLSNIKQINLEDIWNIGYKNGTTRKLSHWTNTLIRDKLIDTADLQGVLVNLQSSTYMSQRCSGCGLVRKSNRKGKRYLCASCGLEIDADLNAAKNHEISLPEVPWNLRRLNLNRGGFIWSPLGFYDLAGTELTVPISN